MSAIINAEFGWATDFWKSEGTVTTSVAWNTSMSGPSALRIEATESDRAEVCQETPTGPGSPPNRYLISFSKGKSYKISFLARSLSGTGIIKVTLSDVSGSGDEFWTSDPVVLSGKLNEYSVQYNHTGEDIKNGRLAFCFNEMDQTILLDKVALRGFPLKENVMPKVEIISPQDSSIIPHGSEEMLRIEASDPDGSISSVQIYLNGVETYTYQHRPYTLALDSLSPGNYHMLAVARDDREGMASDSIFIRVTDTTSSAVSKISSSGFFIYPNPTTSTLHFNMTSDYEIYSLSGRKILEGKEAIQVDISSLNCGLFVLKTNYGVHKLSKV